MIQTGDWMVRLVPMLTGLGVVVVSALLAKFVLHSRKKKVQSQRSMPLMYSQRSKAQYTVQPTRQSALMPRMYSQRGKAQYAAYVQLTRQKHSMPRIYCQRGKAQYAAYVQPMRQKAQYAAYVLPTR